MLSAKSVVSPMGYRAWYHTGLIALGNKKLPGGNKIYSTRLLGEQLENEQNFLYFFSTIWGFIFSQGNLNLWEGYIISMGNLFF